MNCICHFINVLLNDYSLFKEKIDFNCVITIRCQGMECYKANGRKTGRTVSAINAPLFFFNLNL